MFNVGDMVVIESRTWPGINKPGGVAKVIKVDTEDETVDVKYTLGGSEKKVEFIYAKLWDIYSSSSAAAARRSATVSAAATVNNSIRNIARSSSREKTAPTNHNNCRGTNTKPTKIAMNTKTSHSSSCLQPNKDSTNLSSLTIPRKLKRLPLSESNNHQVIDAKLQTQLEGTKDNDNVKKQKLVKAATVVTSTPTTLSPQPTASPHDGTTKLNHEKENRPECPSFSAKPSSTPSSGTDPSADDATTKRKATVQTLPIDATTTNVTALVQQPTVLPPTKVVVPSSKWTAGTACGSGYPSMPQSPLPPKKRMLLRTTLEQQQQQQKYETSYSLSHEPSALLPKSSEDGHSNSAASVTSQQQHVPKTSYVRTVEGRVDVQSVTSTTITSCNTTDASKSRSTPWKKRYHLLTTSLTTPSPKDEGIRNETTTDTNKNKTYCATTRGTLWKKRHHLLSTSFVTPSPKAEGRKDTKNSSYEDSASNYISTEIVCSHSTKDTNTQGSTHWKKRHTAYLVSSSFGTPSPTCYYH